jgi:hypothetical protein
MEEERYVVCSTQGIIQECTFYTLFVKSSTLGTRQIYDHTWEWTRLLSIIVT